MGKEFIEQKYNSAFLSIAKRQQKQLSYFTQSQVQDEITLEYTKAWAERNYSTNDPFLNWVKQLFRTDNFMSFYRYHRYPVASSKLVNNKIKLQLARVFYAEDSYFNYIINGQEETEPENLDVHKFNEIVFNALLFRHNDIIVADLEDVNKPYRELVSIEDVISIDSEHGKIERIAFAACMDYVDESGNEHEIKGYSYLDDKVYAFYDKEHNLIKEVPHDLGKCPADYVSSEPFDSSNDVVRKSIFSHVLPDMEEFVFLKTLQKMTEPNGAIPIITKLKTKEKTSDSKGKKGSSSNEPMTAYEVGGQESQEFGKESTNGSSIMQTGTEISVPIVKKDDGSIDMDVVTNFVKFFHHPVENLEYVNKRIHEIEMNILSSVLGDLADQTDERKNELQVKGGFVSAQDRLRGISAQLTRIRRRSDYKMLALQYGTERVEVDAFYGSDFYLESQDTLYELFKISPNPIERRSILVRLSKNRNKFNRSKSEREVILYSLLPYVSDVDFTAARESFAVDKSTFQLQTRFNYWISMFEATYGDIVQFWDSNESPESQKLIEINNLLTEIITRTVGQLPEPAQPTPPPAN